MNTDFGAKLQNALDVAQNDINRLVWRDKNNQDIRLMDMSHDELKKCYQHAYEMLYNDSYRRVGRVIMKENIKKCWNSCNTELFVRGLYTMENSPIRTNKELLDFLNEMKSVNNLTNDMSISTLFNHLDPQFESITINDLFNACFDRLGTINRKIVTNQYIYSIGIWLTDEELRDLTEYDDTGKIRDRREVIKERLFLASPVRLRTNSEGFTFAELRTLVQMGDFPKVTSLPTVALKALRDKVLILLEADTNYHIDKWTGLLNDVKRVAEYKNWQLD